MGNGQFQGEKNTRGYLVFPTTQKCVAGQIDPELNIIRVKHLKTNWKKRTKELIWNESSKKINHQLIKIDWSNIQIQRTNGHL